jgi:predicted MFS family arabinose efflux permease
MHLNRSVALACGGLVALAAALGIGRFVYTPILPVMLDALGWSKAEAGLVASANYLGYFVGALAAGRPFASARPRQWLLIALVVSALSTAGMALPSEITSFIGLRFIGGMASAFVIVCASTLVLESLALSGRGSLSAVHFSGVGVGIMISAAAVSAVLASGADWRGLWIASGSIAMLAVIVVPLLIPAHDGVKAAPKSEHKGGASVRLTLIIVAYGLFGFGYVITATFLVAIVRLTNEIRLLEPWIWMLFGLASIPSITVWRRLGERIGLMNAFAAACIVEAIGVAASVEWVTISGVCLSAILLGGTFMGITALGLMIARDLAADQSQRAVGRMTASFGVGQMVGPTLAGFLFEQFGSFRAASLVAVAALIVSAGLAIWTASGMVRDASQHRIA